MFTISLSPQTNLSHQQFRAPASLIKSAFLRLSRLFFFFSMACLGMAGSAEARAGERSIQEEISETGGSGRRQSLGSASSVAGLSSPSGYNQARNLSFDDFSDWESESWSAVSSSSSSVHERTPCWSPSDASSLSSSTSALSSGRNTPPAEGSDLYRVQQEIDQEGNNLLNAGFDDMARLTERLHEVRAQRQLLSSQQEEISQESSNANSTYTNQEGLGSSDTYETAVATDGMGLIFPTVSMGNDEGTAEGGVDGNHTSATLHHSSEQIQAVEKAPLNQQQVNVEAPAAQTNSPLKQVSIAVSASAKHGSMSDGSKMSANGPIIMSNIAPGAVSSTSTDAVNGAQLFGGLAASRHYTDQRVSGVQRNINQVARHAYSGIAAAMAMPNQTPRENGNTVVAVGAANFKGQNAIALGVTHRSRNGQYLVHGAASKAGSAGMGVRVQAGYEF